MAGTQIFAKQELEILLWGLHTLLPWKTQLHFDQKKNQKNPSTLHCIPFTSINMTHISQHKLPYSERIIGLHPRSQESMGFEIHSCKKGVCCRIHRNSDTKDRPHSTSQELCVLSQLFLFRGFLCIISTSLCLLGLSGFCFLVQILKIENLIGCWSAKSN